jgi:abnormal spindle-like microcephaly-associated protein
LWFHFRVPAQSRLNKIHNVSVALEAAKQAGGAGEMMSKDNALSREIVDGARDKTLPLIWGLLREFMLPRIVDASTLKEEIVRTRMGMGAGKMSPIKLSDEPAELVLQWVQVICSLLNPKP